MDIDFSRAKELGDQLLAQLDALREESPLFWSRNQRAWLVTGNSLVQEGFRGTLPLSAAARLQRIFSVLPAAERHRIPYLQETLPRFLISLDPPEQMRIRKLLLRAFGRAVVEEQRPYVRQMVATLLDAVLRNEEIEFVERVARHIPGQVILRLMGLSEAYFPRLRAWASALTAGIGGGGATLASFEACEAALLEMRELFREELNRRRSDPGEDFLSSLITSEEDGDRLSEEEALATCYLTITAGHETTTNTLTLGTLALARSPEAMVFIRENPQSIGLAIMEIMRVIGMSTAMVRTVVEDFEWHGQQLRKGDLVYLMIAGANRDPAAFADPLQLDLSRPQSANVTFAPGLHHCIGHLLARMQLTEFFQALSARCKKIDVIDERLDWGTSIGFRGLQTLRLKLHPRS